MQPKRTINSLTNSSPTYYGIQLLSAFLFIVSTVNAQKVRCSLRESQDSGYVGSCQIKDSLIFSLNLKPAKGGKTGIWKGKSSRQGISADDNIFLEITSTGGTLATVYRSGSGMACGWYDVSNLEINNSQLTFSYNWQELTKPQSRDVIILKQVKAYFSDSLKWDRYDLRVSGHGECPSKTKKKTLFCALTAAQNKVLGHFYGGPSFWAMGQAIMRSGRYPHPIQAFNNDLKTSFKMLQEMLDHAISRMSEQISGDTSAKKVAPTTTATVEQMVLDIRSEFNLINSLQLTPKKYKFVCDTDGTIIYYTDNDKVVKIAIDWGFIGDRSSTSEYYYKEGKLIFTYETYIGASAGLPETKTEYRTYVNDDKTIKYMENQKVTTCITCQFNESSREYKALRAFNTSYIKSALCD